MLDNRIASEPIRNARLEICKKCEHNKLGVCSKCGCILRLKTQWKSTKCPVGKWGSVPS
jgi:hypothetical protein